MTGIYNLLPSTTAGNGRFGSVLDVVDAANPTLRYAAVSGVPSLGGLVVATPSLQPFAVTTFAATAFARFGAQTRVGDLLRIESGAANTTGLIGAGMELKYDASDYGQIRCYNYTTAALETLKINALSVVLSTTSGFQVLTGGVTSSAGANYFVGTTEFRNTLTIQAAVSPTLYGTITANNGSFVFGTDAVGTTDIRFQINASDALVISTAKLATFYGGITMNTGKVITKLSATGAAGFNLPHGAAPSSPVDGDMWTTAAGGLYVRINGSTIGPLT